MVDRMLLQGRKSLLKLDRDFQPVNYDTTISSTALVFTRFIHTGMDTQKEYDVLDIELSDALNKLVSIIADGLANGTIRMNESVRGESLNWYVSQPNFVVNFVYHLTKLQMFSTCSIICGKQLADVEPYFYLLLIYKFKPLSRVSVS